MQAPLSNEASTSAARRRWQIGIALTLLALGAASFFRPRHAPEAAVNADTRAVSAPAPRSRALRRAAPPSLPDAPEANVSPMIKGVVLGADGAPVAGAAVVARTFQVAGNVPMTMGEVQADEQGRFELRVPEGAYYIHASREGYGPTFAQAQSGDEVSLVLPKSGVVEGHVHDPDGKPLTHFTVDIVTMAPEGSAALAPMWSRTFDSPDGSFRVTELPAWAVTIRATAPGYAPAFSAPVQAPAGKTSSVELSMSSGCTVEGTVQDGSGTALPEVFLDAEARKGAGSMVEVSMDSASQAKSDMTGHFRLEHVPTGQVSIRAYDGANAVTTVHLDIKECGSVAPVKVTMSPGGSIAGIVRDADGKPVAGARLSAITRATGFVTTFSDAEGRFRFDQLPPSAVNVEVHHGQQQAQVSVMVEENKVAEPEIKLPPRGDGVLAGRVTAGGKALGGAQVAAVAALGDGLNTFYATTAEDGSYQLTGVPAGSYLVQVASTMVFDKAKVQQNDTVTVNLELNK
jgi:hypothetical protein